jgi:hypothetical protein
MPDSAPQAELLRALGRLVRGLSALFWGLPLALVVGVQTARTDWLRPFGIMPPVVASSLLFYGLWQLGRFQKQERVWRQSLERAKLAAIFSLGLSPFLYWWCQLPEVFFFKLMAMGLVLSGLAFLYCLNLVLQRLAAMLPDETLRHETRLFTSVNIYFLLAILVFTSSTFLVILLRSATRFAGSHYMATLFKPVPQMVYFFLVDSGTLWLMVLVVLLPLAITMALIWKIKEVILTSVFGPDHHQEG